MYATKHSFAMSTMYFYEYSFIQTTKGLVKKGCPHEVYSVLTIVLAFSLLAPSQSSNRLARTHSRQINFDNVVHQLVLQDRSPHPTPH